MTETFFEVVVTRKGNSTINHKREDEKSALILYSKYKRDAQEDKSIVTIEFFQTKRTSIGNWERGA